MTLHSQASRAGSSRQFMSSRRRRSKAAPLAIAGALLLAGALVFLLWPWGAPSQVSDADANPVAASPNADDHGSTSHAAAMVKPEPDTPAKTPDQPKAHSLNLDQIPAEREAPPFSTPKKSSSSSSTSSHVRAPGPGVGSPSSTSDSAPHSAPQSTAHPAPPTAAHVSAYTGDAAADRLRKGMKLIGDGKLVAGRAVLSDVLFNDKYRLADRDAQAVRDTLMSVNKKLVFSPQVVAGDPLAEKYTVQSGDLLARIGPRYGLPYQFLERINQLKARNLRAGQTIKLIKGPFHVRVVKHAFRLDVYLRAPDGSPIYVCSYPVGLGEENSTPIGSWVIKPGSKVVNPDYRNPRTGEYFKRDNPKNPVGEYWMAIKGAGENTAGKTGYGIHGTVAPSSIGTMASLGCVRLHSDDIKSLFYMLDAGKTTVQIVP